MSSLNQNVIRHKIGLLNLATELGNVSKDSEVMGDWAEVSRRHSSQTPTVMGGTG